MVITGEQLQQLVTSSGVDPEVAFRERLKKSSTDFVTDFEKWIEAEALEIAGRGRRSAHRKYPMAFHERLNGFRLSTYVKGFRTSDGVFDATRFAEIEFNATPFATACENLKTRGIIVEDVSDPARGLGFWLKISF
jgi:hypothetical protein